MVKSVLSPIGLKLTLNVDLDVKPHQKSLWLDPLTPNSYNMTINGKNSKIYTFHTK